MSASRPSVRARRSSRCADFGAPGRFVLTTALDRGVVVAGGVQGPVEDGARGKAIAVEIADDVDA